MDLTVLHSISYGMYIVGAKDGGRLFGCIANAMIQVTSENPIFALSMNKSNRTTKAILDSGNFSVSILSEDVPAEWISVFGYRSSEDTDKFRDIPFEEIGGVPCVTEKTCGALIFEVISVSDMETHSVIFGRLKDIRSASVPASPMTYSYYHKVLKGKAPKNAPTFIESAPEEKKESVSYVCSVCGYVYEGDLTKEPDSFRCPICKVPKEKFNKI